MPGGGNLRVRIAAKSHQLADGWRHDVLEDVAFSGAPGEVLALLAPSGTGKTTVLRIVLGLDRAFRGEIVRPAGRLGVMFQEPRLLPWLSVAANLELVAADAAGEIPGLLAEVGLEGKESLHPRALSLGMARRVALVRALLGTPALLVLDEPFASLDPRAAGELAGLVARQARARGALVLLATHDLDQALGLADRVLVLSGSPARLAADWPVGQAGGECNDGDAARVKRELVARFPFLRGAGEDAP
ncbi:MAG: ABC transporter ATP-binding protein [Acetobacteraceae bacterium]